jgi:hypothetical protein
MKRPKLWLTIIFAVSACVLVTESAAAQSYCRESEESEDDVRSWILWLVTEADTRAKALRPGTSLPKLTDSSEVYLVLDEEICFKAAQAVAAVFGDDTLRPPPVHVLRVGPTRFVAYNYLENGHTFYFPILDEQFRYIISIG